MNRKLYETPGDFLRENRDFLRKNEAVCQLNLGNCITHAQEKCRPGLLFGRYEEAGAMCLLFGDTAPWNICLNAPLGMEASIQAAADLARYLLEENIEIAGVTARKDLADAFMGAYGEQFTLRSSMDIMVLRETIAPEKQPGLVRNTTADDIDLVAQWCHGFYLDIHGEEHSLEDIRKEQGERVKNGLYYLFETPEGQPVSMAAAFRDLSHGICISGVYTPPQYRGQGYCQNTVAALCREKLSEGKDYCTLFVDKKNPISNRVYKKIGFEIVENCYEYKLSK